MQQEADTEVAVAIRLVMQAETFFHQCLVEVEAIQGKGVAMGVGLAHELGLAHTRLDIARVAKVRSVEYLAKAKARAEVVAFECRESGTFHPLNVIINCAMT